MRAIFVIGIASIFAIIKTEIFLFVREENQHLNSMLMNSIPNDINSVLKLKALLMAPKFEAVIKQLDTYIEPEQQYILHGDLLPTISSQNLLQHCLWLAMVSAENQACSVRPECDKVIN